MNPTATDSSDNCSRLIAACRGKRVVVFGDLIADEFVYGRIARVSREAPVLILEYDATEIVPGGAGNAANNVASLGGTVRLVSLVGRDEAGRRLFKVLPRAVERAGLSRPGRLSHAGQDAHPRRRHSLGEAAGRAHRSPHRASRSATRIARAGRTRRHGARSRTPMRC